MGCDVAGVVARWSTTSGVALRANLLAYSHSPLEIEKSKSNSNSNSKRRRRKKCVVVLDEEEDDDDNENEEDDEEEDSPFLASSSRNFKQLTKLECEQER